MEKNFCKKVLYVLRKLPRDVQDTIDDDVVVVIVGESHGYCIGRSIDKTIIIINFWWMTYFGYGKGMSLKHQRHVIAHEFAHFILGHVIGGKDITEVEETEADSLAIGWGFPPDEKYTK